MLKEAGKNKIPLSQADTMKAKEAVKIKKKLVLFIALLMLAVTASMQNAFALFTAYTEKELSVTSGKFSRPYLMAGEDFNRTTSPVKSGIETAVFVDYIPELDGYTYGVDKFDVSKQQDFTVIAWVVGTKMYIGGEGGIVADPSLNDMFSYYTSLKSVTFDKVLDTSPSTSARRMFLSCTSLTTVDLNNITTGGITNFQLMFGNCTAIRNVDITSWDVGKAENMSGMFLNCNYLMKAEVGVKDARKVITFEGMFKDCNRLNTVDLSSMRTRDAVSYANMFSGCSFLRELDLSGFTMREDTTLSQMFAYSGLGTVYASGNWSEVVKTDSLPFWHSANLTNSTVSDFEGVDMANYDNGYLTYKAYTGE